MYDALIKLNSIKDYYTRLSTSLTSTLARLRSLPMTMSSDAKSLMSMLSLDLSKPLELSFDSDEASDILSQLQPFILHE